jgi:hypothetical protein
MLATPSITVATPAGSGLSGGGTVALGGTITLKNTVVGGAGTVTNVATGTGLTGGPITSTGTLGLDTSYTDARYLQHSGGTLTGALAGPSAAFSGALTAQTGTFSGTVSAAGAVMTPTGTATATQGYVSNPLDLEASSFNTNLQAPASFLYRWQAEPSQNDSGNSAATLNLLFGVPGDVLETGLSVSKNGVINFAPNQTFPGGSGTGTVTSVATGAGLTGGPITSTGTVSIATAGVTNTMLANNSITVVAGSGMSGGGKVALGGTVTVTNAAPATVTAVTAGSGLAGGGSTGNVTLSLLKTCGSGQTLLWNGTAWVCGTPSGSGGGVSGTTDGIAYFSGATTLTSTAAPTNGQILIGSTGAAPVLSTLTAGQNVSITNSPGAVTISATGGSAPTLPFFATGGERTDSTQAATQNANKVWGFLLPYNVTSSEMTYDVTTADNTTNRYDLGIFNSSGDLVVNIGPTAGSSFAPASGFRTLKWIQGSTALAAGRYYLAFTTNCASSCAVLGAAASYVSFAVNVSAGTSQGGALPSTMTPPADTWGAGAQPTVVINK